MSKRSVASPAGMSLGKAQDTAEAVKEACWVKRHAFHADVVPVADAVREAIETEDGPVVLGDLLVWEATQYFSIGAVPEPMGSAHRMFAPYQAIRCADGYITLGAANQRTWERCAQVIGRPDLIERPEYVDNAHRMQNCHQLAREIEAVTTTKPRHHWLKVLEEAGMPCGLILNYAEVFADSHVQARSMVQEIDHPVGGRIRMLGPAAKSPETPARCSRPSPL